MLQQTDWLETESDESASLPEGSPAPTYHLRGDGTVCPVSAAACGPSSSEYALKFDPVGLSLRTSLGCALSALTGCSLTWQEQVTPLGRWWWVLSTPEPLIDGSGFGLVPTICAADCSDPKKGERGELSAFLRGTKGYAERMLPTPKASDGRPKGNGGDRNSPELDQMAKAGMLPTPTAIDAQGRGYQYSNGDHSKPVLTLPGAVGAAKSPRNGPGTGRLSPCFVEWMMGYPAGWTDVSD